MSGARHSSLSWEALVVVESFVVRLKRFIDGHVRRFWIWQQDGEVVVGSARQDLVKAAVALICYQATCDHNDHSEHYIVITLTAAFSGLRMSWWTPLST